MGRLPHLPPVSGRGCVNESLIESLLQYPYPEEVAGGVFGQGDGRQARRHPGAAFILENLILMQNDLLPLDVYDRHRDQGRYFEACGHVEDFQVVRATAAGVPG